MTSHPYRGPGTATPARGDFSQTHVGDHTDTSPFVDPDPVIGISIERYIRNMKTLIDFVDQGR